MAANKLALDARLPQFSDDPRARIFLARLYELFREYATTINGIDTSGGGGGGSVGATLTALEAISSSSGLVEQTSADVFGIRSIGSGSSSSILSRGDGDSRYSLTGHTHSGYLGVPVQVTVDFGPGALSKTFDVTVAGADTGMRVLAVPSLDAGVSEDEFEMDPWTVAAKVTGTNAVRIIATSTAGLLFGERKINVLVG